MLYHIKEETKMAESKCEPSRISYMTKSKMPYPGFQVLPTKIWGFIWGPNKKNKDEFGVIFRGYQ